MVRVRKASLIPSLVILQLFVCYILSCPRDGGECKHPHLALLAIPVILPLTKPPPNMLV